ncbi:MULTISPECIES: hypothetical protein [Mesonia]|uniref:Uncharacterized protein n=1 Tax=Mesonia oceanica TaxID=2687242 RepID=A0AC61Y340_9FLAO|nr:MULTISPECIES: hypothetical protein [Mesonia]MAN28632.1 hypothetical protein [Mesonia sp.]MAQ41313.1 hypothetical protein [Mesonia sp.]MBJ97412.1 hypothetical protein [Flavobacteriaceae bacterium]VVU98886.1 hypothetical protein FVB9532_00134 [Mesonia oceanica]|tara:strand:+ start:48084 stop:48506 length:423 start_codon:yes stop_codon:yes gene_type:complete
MKRNFLVLLVILGSIFSCSLDDEVNPTYAFELAPIDSVSLPDTLTYGHTYDFEITYERASDCHTFEWFEYTKDTNERKIYVVNRVYLNENNCEDLEDELATKKLPFEVIRQDYYIFKFWQGINANEEDIFLTKRIPVKIE